MLHIVLQKIQNKKWLNLCLLAGITLLVAVFSCHPMFEKGADNQLLQSAFAEYVEQKEAYPATLYRTATYETGSYGSVADIVGQMKAYEAKWMEYVDVEPVASQRFLYLSEGSADSNLGSRSTMLSIGYLDDLENHITIVKGEGFSADSGAAFGCVVSQSAMDNYGFVVGQTLIYNHMTNAAGEPVTLVITGICEIADEEDNYWNTPLSDFDGTVFVSEESFDRLIGSYGYDTVSTKDALLLDYTQMDWSNAASFASYIAQFSAVDSAFSTNLTSTLDSYLTQSRNVAVILFVLELPCVVLLLLFIYMVSNQIIGNEEGEIAVLRSRGVTRMQTVRLYLLQSGVLSVVGFFAGLLLGFGMCKLAASTDGFLKFASKDVSLYSFNWLMLSFALAACMIAILFMSMPVWKRSKITIVEQKSKKSYRKSVPLWERYFADVLLLGVSGYLLYNYNRQSDLMAASILAGESLDPMIFLDASLFIFACGLLFMRLSHYLVRLVNRIGEKRWKPALYASFLQITRTFRSQSFIMVFLIMTIANGIFDANMARTINENSEERIRYNVGCDVKVRENWTRHIYTNSSGEMDCYYDEPDFGDYEQLVKDGICESVTKVLIDDDVQIYNGKNNTSIGDCTLMSIHTKEFGETAELADGINDTHWYYALNALAEDAEGAIISRNMADALGLSVGDTINYGRYSGVGSGDTVKALTSVTVCAIVDGFPGYQRYSYTKDRSGTYTQTESYLLVTNYADEISTYGVTPYQVWMKLSGSGSMEQVTSALEELGKRLIVQEGMAEEIEASKSAALFQITNGLFTMSFLISILVCSVGFLIYQVMSLKNRELLFGIYRAMGMRMGEIRLMLVNEQLFSTVLSLAAGGAAGALSTALFIRLIALVYLPQKHNIAIHLIVNAWDLVKLFAVVFAVVVVCVIVIRTLLKNMKIAQALKLGED